MVNRNLTNAPLAEEEPIAPLLQMHNVDKYYGKNHVVKGISLTIRKGEILTLLGPSGCGKTTTLRMVIGLERSDGGEITYKEKVIDSRSQKKFLSSNERDMGIVFQSYAIWPQMTVFENVAFPLRVRKVKNEVVRREVERALDLVGLLHLADRPAPQLSGGQQQRVAFARSLVYHPDLLLLDEPFSNLDARLREQMRIEVKQLQERIGITVLFVTHDQIEGLALSDRIAVMNNGTIEQLGSPAELYDRPATPFVRDFLGKILIFNGCVQGSNKDEITVIMDGDQDHRIVTMHHLSTSSIQGAKCEVSVRPEQIDVTPYGSGQVLDNNVPGEIQSLYFIGDQYESQIKIPDEQIININLPRTYDWHTGQRVNLSFRKEAARLWLK
jgi:ABC-type Fe3+/spermidine/putrescine transport system ATPase subunit